MAKNDVYVANTTFSTDLDGAAVTIHKGRTRVREGHLLQKSVPDLFDRVDADVQYDVETADAVPGTSRGVMPDTVSTVHDPPVLEPKSEPSKHTSKSVHKRG